MTRSSFSVNVFRTRPRLKSSRTSPSQKPHAASFLDIRTHSCVAGGLRYQEGLTLRRRALQSRHYDDWTIESWRIEPRLRALEVDIDEPEQNPPLWKDLTLASVIAALLWGAAAMIFA